MHGLCTTHPPAPGTEAPGGYPPHNSHRIYRTGQIQGFVSHGLTCLFMEKIGYALHSLRYRVPGQLALPDHKNPPTY